MASKQITPDAVFFFKKFVRMVELVDIGPGERQAQLVPKQNGPTTRPRFYRYGFRLRVKRAPKEGDTVLPGLV